MFEMDFINTSDKKIDINAIKSEVLEIMSEF